MEPDAVTGIYDFKLPTKLTNLLTKEEEDAKKLEEEADKKESKEEEKEEEEEEKEVCFEPSMFLFRRMMKRHLIP